MGQDEAEFESRVVVVGVGLIGGSIAAAIRSRHPGCEVVGLGRNSERLEAAQAAGLLTSYAMETAPELFTGRTLVVVCLPVHLIADAVQQIAAVASADTVITDAGSVKGMICDAVSADPVAAARFVPAHPIAGGEQGGFEFADGYLFDGRVCVIVDGFDPGNTQRVSSFWSALGCELKTLSAAEHDRRLALTSHLPHVMAAVTTQVVGSENLPLTGSGFRDTTRIAAGDAQLWRSILAGNRQQVLQALDCAAASLAEFRDRLADGDDDQVEQLLQEAAECRSRLHETA
ncbi:MAG: prephenate dehydrogenase/arogenate dehydrogenase family protein [Fuerstiella sp.]